MPQQTHLLNDGSTLSLQDRLSSSAAMYPAFLGRSFSSSLTELSSCSYPFTGVRYSSVRG